MDWVFLTVGGFLLGCFFRTAYFTTRYEPNVKLGYAVVGAGILASVGLSTWVDFSRDVSDWTRALTLTSYAVIALGLVLINRERSHR